MKKLSKNGYKKNSPDKNNSYNIIPGNSITMQDVQFPVTGISMNTGEIKNMHPGNEYYFPNTDQVLEYPMFMQMGGQQSYTPEQWNKMNSEKGLLASPGNSVNLSGKQNSKYMEFYDPKTFMPSASNSEASSEINWKKINDPNWKYTDKNNSPFVSYTPPVSTPPIQKKYVQPSNERVAVGFQPNYTTYKYNDGSTKYQDTNGNLYNDAEELQGYLENLVKKKMGGPLDKFVGNYAKKQLNLSQAPQGESMDDFLTTKGVDFIDYIASNTKKALVNKEVSEFKKFQKGGESENKYQVWKRTLPVNLQYEGDYDLRSFYKENPNFNPKDKNQHLTDKFKLPNHPSFSNESIYYNTETMNKGGFWNGENYVPNDPLNKKFQMGGGMENYYSGPFSPFNNQQNPDYVDSFVQSNPYNPYQQLVAEQPVDNSRRNNNIADLGMAGAQVLNKFFNTQNANIQNKRNMSQLSIDKTAQLQYGNRGDYDINQGNFRPNQYTTPSYKKGGEYSVKESDLGTLLSQGYEFEIID